MKETEDNAMMALIKESLMQKKFVVNIIVNNNYFNAPVGNVYEECKDRRRDCYGQ
ncbi:MAG: hypothetical protein IJ190_03335 [Prevotella sp.]|nr:hypothetical protein [Prevotella sp.]